MLAYLLERVLESYFYEQGKHRITARRILGHLSKISLVVSEISGHKFVKITEMTPEVKAILKKVGMKKFKDTYYLEKKTVTLPDITLSKITKYGVCSR